MLNLQVFFLINKYFLEILSLSFILKRKKRKKREGRMSSPNGFTDKDFLAAQTFISLNLGTDMKIYSSALLKV